MPRDCHAPRARQPHHGRSGLAALWLIAMAHGVGAQIRTDSSLGLPAQTLLGPAYVIPQAVGRLAGNNLFHSFEAFNILGGQSANFTTTTPNLANVVSRVTGGTASAINGQLKLTPVSGAPNFFFINPAGVAFGAGTSVDVPGAFHVSTANYVKFGEGSFHADLGQTSTFSSAAPQAFGFLGATRAPITVKDGATLALAGSQAVSMAAGDIEINNATVATVAGELRVLALGLNTQEFAFSGALPAGAGDLSIKNGGQLSSATSSSVNAGNVSVSAGTITIDRQGNTRPTRIASQANAGSGNAGSVEVVASGDLSVLNGGRISADTLSAGAAGSVKVAARNAIIDGQRADLLGFSTGIQSVSQTGATGNSGSVAVTATDNLSVLSGGRISTSTNSLGNAGSVKISASSIGIDRQLSTFRTGIHSRSDSQVIGLPGGDAGSVDIVAIGNIAVVNGGSIETRTVTTGGGGTVKVSAESILLDGRDSTAFTAIRSGADLGGGTGGSVVIAVSGGLSILDSAKVSADSFTSLGVGGSVKVTAGSIFIDGVKNLPGLPFSDTGITSDACPCNNAGTGVAGTIQVTAIDSISIVNGGRISSSTFTSRPAGSVTVSATKVIVDGQALGFAAIISRARPGSSGNAGRVEVTATDGISVRNAGIISSETGGSGSAGIVHIDAATVLVEGSGASIDALARAGSSGQTGGVEVNASKSITLSNGGRLSIRNDATVANPAALVPTTLKVQAPDITLKDASITAASTGNVAASDIQVNFTNRLSLDPSSITTSANLGNGGAISIFGGKIITLENSQITTSVLGLAGNGGNILLNADALVLNTGFIQANTGAPNAAGGLVKLNLQTLVTSGNSLLVGGNVPNVFQPGVFGYNVVQAAAPTGVSGVVQITTPLLDVTGSLSGLSTQVLDTGGLGRNPCQVKRGSTLAQSGRGGLAPSARGLLDVEPQFAQVRAAQSPLPEIHARADSAGCL